MSKVGYIKALSQSALGQVKFGALELTVNAKLYTKLANTGN